MALWSSCFFPLPGWRRRWWWRCFLWGCSCWKPDTLHLDRHGFDSLGHGACLDLALSLWRDKLQQLCMLQAKGSLCVLRQLLQLLAQQSGRLEGCSPAGDHHELIHNLGNFGSRCCTSACVMQQKAKDLMSLIHLFVKSCNVTSTLYAAYAELDECLCPAAIHLGIVIKRGSSVNTLLKGSKCSASSGRGDLQLFLRGGSCASDPVEALRGWALLLDLINQLLLLDCLANVFTPVLCCHEMHRLQGTRRDSLLDSLVLDG
mmetsp:Transcript_110480/g.202526  ORF Transcript_110480/g.202526 Transcript_110480/m.202526 type:complete len:260 (+) Transcript_110480:610-1389(+)